MAARHPAHARISVDAPRSRMNDRVCLLAIAIALAVGVPAVAQTSRPPEFVLERPSLNFSILIRPGAAPLTTPPQVVFLERGESTDATYVVESSPAWLGISSRSGATPARLTLAVRPDAISAAAVDQRAEVVITSATGQTRHVLHTALRVVR